MPLVPAWRVERAFEYALSSKLEGQVVEGSLVRVPFGGRSVRGIVVGIDSGDPGGLQEVKGLVTSVPVAPGPHLDLLRWLARRYLVPLGRSLERTVPARVRVRAPEIRPLDGSTSPNLLRRYHGGLELLSAVTGKSGRVWCLRTAPGENRAALLDEILGAAGRGGTAALVAVPEVRFGSPLLEQVEHLRPELARLDTSRSPAERSHAWLRLAAGHGLGAGGRSAVLTPSPTLGVVVVDDEHHVAFHEDRAPRYDARRVAIERANLQDATCVLVSSTPSLESYGPALEGRYGLAEPFRSAERDARPLVEVFESPTHFVIGRELHRRVHDALGRGERVALLAPARGFARALWCGACRRSLRCPVCEHGLIHHRRPPRVRCGHCHFDSPPPDSCPECGASEWRFMGAGSERLEEQVGRTWPRARVARMDPDVQDPVPVEDVDIYVTTWFGTKPALRPRVSTIGVLDADALLRLSDWRAAESAYQALAAMAEWAGPASRGGHLLVQTAEPAHEAIQAVVRGDFGHFARRELDLRRELNYPPFCELIRARASGPRRAGLIERACGFARRRGAGVLGPIELEVKGGDGEVEQIAEALFKCRAAEPLCDDLRGILAAAPRGNGIRFDVDPR